MGQFINAQEGMPLNSNYLIENGISPRVLDAAASELLQDGSFIQNLSITIALQDNSTRTYKTQIIYDPSFKDGKDIRFVVETGTFNKNEIKQLKKAIEKSHKMGRLSRKYLYDETSLKLISSNYNEQIISFKYSKDDIEPELQDIKKLTGKIHIVDGVLNKVVLSNTKPLSQGKSDYTKTVFYEKIETQKGYIVSYIEEKFRIKDIKYTMNFTTSDYKTSEGKTITWSGKENISEFLSQETAKDTVNVTLGWALPIWGKPATKLGYGLPRPIGLNAIVHTQESTLDFTGLGISLNDGKINPLNDLFDIEGSFLTENTTTYMVRSDVWIFPFLNVMGLVGTLDNSISGNLILDQELRETLVNLAPALGLNPADIPSQIPLNVDVTANLYGGGLTLAGGIDDVFFSANYQFILANVKEANTSTLVHSLLPLVGYRLPYDFNIMAGALGQFYDSDIKGFIETDTGDVLNYNVSFEPIVWNGLVGVYKGFGKHWDLLFQVGFGDRKTTTVQFGYRF
ncbi:hypothetical protein [uncultured Algibacter sp.]|uniref:hypothetical protein n=1 Tax=uncultured Algibacter sp. TaxID=298659 RepID=UPI0026263028|nr:hypothetical protein [uncultured Algibacter sp.]